tara:strand:- start:159 stop:572 length:414 start_codon:yes stop_codon:yes gene_type:complete
MATITANISLLNDIASASVSNTQTATLYKPGGTEGMDTMTSVSKVLTSTDQVDLITAASVSTSHNYVYVSNPSTISTEFITVGIGNAGAGSPTDTEEFGRLYGGDWMFIPWTAASNEDIIVTPSVATKMVVEFIVFS